MHEHSPDHEQWQYYNDARGVLEKMIDRRIRQKGITLIEALVAISIMVILMSLAVPAFTGLLERNRLRSAADQLYTDLQYARSEAIKRNAKVYFSVSSGSDWAYGIGTSDACTCSSGSCSSCELKTVTSSEFKNINMTLPTSPTQLYFSPRQGGVSSAVTVGFGNLQGQGANVVLTLLGSPRLCSPNGTFSGYPAC